MLVTRTFTWIIALFLIMFSNVALADPVKQPEEKGYIQAKRYSIGVHVGVSKFGRGKIDNPIYLPGLVTLSEKLTPEQKKELGVSEHGCSPLDEKCRTGSRVSTQISVPIQFDGVGVGFRLEPIFTLAETIKSYGVYIGPTFNFHFVQNFYGGFGFGTRLAWVKADGWERAGDVFFRVPIHLSYYVTKFMCISTDLAVNVGGSIFTSSKSDVTDPTTGVTTTENVTTATFGIVRGVDWSMGVRFQGRR